MKKIFWALVLIVGLFMLMDLSKHGGWYAAIAGAMFGIGLESYIDVKIAEQTSLTKEKS